MVEASSEAAAPGREFQFDTIKAKIEGIID